jgi:hypothetical protein
MIAVEPAEMTSDLSKALLKWTWHSSDRGVVSRSQTGVVGEAIDMSE